jgi:hypothetical protein
MWLFESYLLVIAMLHSGCLHKIPNASRIKAPLPKLSEEVVVVPNAQSGPNEFEISRPVHGVCGASNPSPHPSLVEDLGEEVPNA